MTPASFASRHDEFHQRAIESAPAMGDDFGADDYVEGLRALLDSIDANPPATEFSGVMLEQMISTSLRGRLYSVHHRKQNPGFSDTEIRRPLFIVGLPRSGTTALQKLLTADPANQGLEYWLGQTPMPRPERKIWGSYEEFTACLAQLETLAQLAPDMMAIHEMAADQADECRLLLMQSFANVSFQSSVWVPEYEEWLYSANFAPVYEQFKANLQLIGMSDVRQWVLKDPSHLWAPDVLLSTFPDAGIIQLHREPEQLIPSVSSLVYSSRKMSDPQIDPARVARRELLQWSRVLTNLTRYRQSSSDLQVYDVYMRDLQRDPLAAVQDIYSFFDLEFTAAGRRAVEKWAARHVAPAAESAETASADTGKEHGRHQYSLESFGLDAEEINALFAEYIDAFHR